MLDVVIGGRPRPRHRGARPGDRRRSSRMRPTPWCWRPAATATCSTSPPTPAAATSPPLAGAPARGALRQSLLHADPPDVHPGERRLPVEAHADVGVAAQRRPRLGAGSAGRPARAGQIPEAERDYYLERKYPSFGNLAPRDIATRAAKEVCDEGRGVGPGRRGVYLDFADAIQRLGEAKIAERYGNLFDMYQRITDENPYQVPMRIYPAVHYTMGGLWVDYNLMSTHPRAARARRGELLRPRRQPARRERPDAGPGRRLLRHPAHASATTSPSAKLAPVGTDHPEFRRVEARGDGRGSSALLGSRRDSAPCDSFHRELGKIMWDKCGMARDRSRAEGGARSAFPRCARSSGATCRCPARGAALNQSLEQAGRVADFLELGELMCRDALEREESCGGHFRAEYQTEDGEAQRDDAQFCYVAAWEWAGEGSRRSGSQGAAARSRTSRLSRAVATNEPATMPCRSRSACGGSAGPAAARRAGRQYDVPGRQPGHVVPRDARRA